MSTTTSGSKRTPAGCSRKRLRTAALGMLCAVACGTTSGFVSPHLATSVADGRIIRQRHPPSSSSSSSSLVVLEASKRRSGRSSSPFLSVQDPVATTDRLTHEEQQELLRLSVERRRIKAVEGDLALRSPTLQVSSLQLARAAGYGDRVDELEGALEAGLDARETLVTRNMGLVYYCVNDILGKRRNQQLQSLSKEDLVQEGAIGLARAVDRWNLELGGRFSTYAVYWVRAAVFRCIAERDDLVRVPEHVSATVRKVSRAAQTLGLTIDDEEIDNVLQNVYSNRQANWKQAEQAKALAEEAGITERQLVEAMKVRQRRSQGVLSYESWMQQGKNMEADVSTLAATYDGGDDGESSLAGLERDQMKEILSKFLRPREMEALSWRYGLNSIHGSSATGNKKRDYVREAEQALFADDDDATAPPVKGKWGEAMSFDEVGKRMKVSAEYGRRLCHAAIHKLRQAADDGLLNPAFL